jgi:glycosyltransferase involved in cell wall biosynthesis
MKVGVYLGDVSPTVGGGFTFQDEVLTALLAHAGEVDHRFVILSTRPPAQLQAQTTGRFEFRSIPGPRSVKARQVADLFEPLGTLRRAAGLSNAFDRRIRGAGIDLVWFVAVAFESTETPYIYTMFDLQHRMQPWFPEVSERGRWAVREKSLAHLLRRASLIITPNSAGRDELERFYGIPPERVCLLAHPTPSFALNAGDSDAAALTKLGLQPGYLFYPAQFWPHKNHVGLLHALQLLRDEHGIDKQIVFVGSDRGNRTHIERVAAALGLTSRVRVLGFVERAELVALYRHAAALVYASYFGPENLPPLEAFALGCPVVAAKVSGAREQLGDAAVLVDPADWSAFAEAIKRVLSDERLRADLIARGRERAARWTTVDYVRGVLREIDRFARVRACWPSA